MFIAFSLLPKKTYFTSPPPENLAYCKIVLRIVQTYEYTTKKRKKLYHVHTNTPTDTWSIVTFELNYNSFGSS